MKSMAYYLDLHKYYAYIKDIAEREERSIGQTIKMLILIGLVDHNNKRK